MNRYTHTAVGTLTDALAALPELSDRGPDRERQRANGTEGAAATDPRVCTNVVPTGVRGRPSKSPADTYPAGPAKRGNAVKGGSDLFWPFLALQGIGGGGIRTPGTLSGSTVFKTVALNHSATPPDSFEPQTELKRPIARGRGRSYTVADGRPR